MAIKVVVLDDSMVFRQFVTGVLNREPDIEVVKAFSDPLEARDKVVELLPNVLVVDMEMPKMRGNEFLRAVLPGHPKMKAVVISSRSENVFDAMRAGAIDFVEKPGGSVSNAAFSEDLIQKVHAAAAANARAIKTKAPLSIAAQKPARPATQPTPPPASSNGTRSSRTLIAIGASTGGTEAILEVVKKFPANTPGVVIVQHMPPVFTRMYAERLDKVCPMHVREAENGDRVEQGTILIAPGGTKQMRLNKDLNGYFVQLTDGEKVSGHCPSVDVLFESVAAKAGASAVGVLLTGMGADGAQGLKKMRQAGAYTFGQDEGSCIVYGMPKVAFDIGGVCRQLPLRDIGLAVLQRFRLG